MISAFLNTVKIPELRRRILFTLAVVVIVRLGAVITTPGVNQAVLQRLNPGAGRRDQVRQLEFEIAALGARCQQLGNMGHAQAPSHAYHASIVLRRHPNPTLHSRPSRR